MALTARGNDRHSSCIYGLESDGRPFLVNSLFQNAQRVPLEAGQDADAILRHLDPTVRWFVWHACLTYKINVPRDRSKLSAGLQQRNIRSINEGVIDVSKRHTQAVLSQLGLPTTIADPNGNPEDLLFVKSNHNFGGYAEKQLPQEVRDFFGISLPSQMTPTFSGYRLVERSKLDPSAFQIDDVFIERYVENDRSLFYRAFVLFDSVVLSKLVCRGVIKKALEAEYREDHFLSFADASTNFASAPDQTSRRIMFDLHLFCRAFKLDMGGVDVLLDDSGVPHIIDANPTAWGGENCNRIGFVEHLMNGLDQK